MGTRTRLRRAVRTVLAGSAVGVILTLLPGRSRNRAMHGSGLAAFSTAPCGERSAAELERELVDAPSPTDGRSPTAGESA
jgi:hypothetical protein